MKRLYLIVGFILLLGCVSALRVNEVEINPSEGKEWIELYNEDSNEIDVSSWTLYDGLSSPKKIYTFPNETKINVGGFYVAEINRSSLNNDNNGDFVTLYDNSHQKIDETETLKETSSSDGTWQLCDSEWEFLNSTKGSENICPEETPDENPPDEEQNQTPEEENNQTLLEQENDTISDSNSGPESESEEGHYTAAEEKTATKSITLDTISLSDSDSKDIKSESNNEILKRNLALAGLVSFCMLFGVLFWLKAKKVKKNEFR